MRNGCILPLRIFSCDTCDPWSKVDFQNQAPWSETVTNEPLSAILGLSLVDLAKLGAVIDFLIFRNLNSHGTEVAQIG